MWSGKIRRHVVSWSGFSAFTILSNSVFSETPIYLLLWLVLTVKAVEVFITGGFLWKIQRKSKRRSCLHIVVDCIKGLSTSHSDRGEKKKRTESWIGLQQPLRQMARHKSSILCTHWADKHCSWPWILWIKSKGKHHLPHLIPPVRPSPVGEPPSVSVTERWRCPRTWQALNFTLADWTAVRWSVTIGEFRCECS